MDGRQVRHLASGALLAGSLVSGGTVGNVLLLGSAEHRGDPVGRLSAQLVAKPAAAPARGALAVVTHPAPSARGARAAAWIVVPAGVTTTKSSAAVPPPVLPAPPATKNRSGTTKRRPVTGTRIATSQGSRAAAPQSVATVPATASSSAHDLTEPAGTTARGEKPETPEKPELHSENHAPEHPFDD